MMKADEFKLRMITGVNSLVDTYFGSGSMNERLINSTLKTIIKQKSYIIDDVLTLFTDKDGNINEQEIIDAYAGVIGEDGWVFDIRDYIGNAFIRGLLPDKALRIKMEDIKNMFS